jgi:hypothetical protein
MVGKALCLGYDEQYCSQLQKNFLMLGCSDRRMTSHQCNIIALNYTSWCSCDRPTQKNNDDYEFINVALAAGLGSGVVTLAISFAELIVWYIYRWITTK